MRKLSRWMTVVAATAVLTGYGTIAMAQEPSDADGHLMTGFGTSVQIGGGVIGFTGDATDAVLGTGGSWTARLIFGTRFPVAVETAYIGTANDISALGLDDDALVVSHGFEAAVRWNIVSTFFDRIDIGFVYVDPYIFGGVAYKNYSLANEDFNTSSVGDADDVGELPVGGGIAMSIGGFVIDARGEYRAAFSDNLLGDANDNALSNWGASARLGWEF